VRSIHAARVAAGYPEDDLFQRSAVNLRLLSFIVGVKIAARRLVDLPRAVLLMLFDRLMNLLGLLCE
jgi:hypothetical protein